MDGGSTPLPRTKFFNQKVVVMRVNRFKVKWSYNDVELQSGGTTRQTTCSIEVGDKVVASTKITRNPSDPDDKDMARKISLGRALQFFPKEQRKEFWDEYRAMTKEPRW